MEMYLDLIKEVAHYSSNEFLEIYENSVLSKGQFVLYGKELVRKDWLKENICLSEEYMPLIEQLKVYDGNPILYIFEIANDVKRELILESIRKYSSSEMKRAFPAFTKQRINNAACSILYVGKVVRDFHGRIIQHMGYFKTPQTQGLQLAHWASVIGLDVNVNFYVFKPEMATLIGALEYQMAEKLKPLLGKHK